MEILPNIHQITCPYGNRNVYVYLLRGERSMLIDTAISDSPQWHILPYFEQTGFNPADLTYVLITHPDTDHQGGNDPIRERCPRALFLAHDLDAAWIEDTDTLINNRQDYDLYGFPMTNEGRQRVHAVCHSSTKMDIRLYGGETFRLSPDWSVQTLHTPGHSWGHLTVYDATNRVAIISDAALGNQVPDSMGNPELPPTYRYVDSYLHTLQHLASLPIDTLLTAHFPVMRGDAVQDFLNLSRNYCENAERLILKAIRDSDDPLGLPELISQLSDTLGMWPERRRPLLAWSFLGHLERLEHYDRVLRVDAEDYVKWTSA